MEAWLQVLRPGAGLEEELLRESSPVLVHTELGYFVPQVKCTHFSGHRMQMFCHFHVSVVVGRGHYTISIHTSPLCHACSHLGGCALM